MLITDQHIEWLEEGRERTKEVASAQYFISIRGISINFLCKYSWFCSAFNIDQNYWGLHGLERNPAAISHNMNSSVLE